MKNKLLKIALLVFGVMAIAAAMADPRQVEASGKLAVGAMLLSAYEVLNTHATDHGRFGGLTKSPPPKAGVPPGGKEN